MTIQTLVLAAAIATVSTPTLKADSYRVYLPPAPQTNENSQELCSYLYAETTVSNAIPNAPYGTGLYLWDRLGSNWVMESYSSKLQRWTPGTNVLHPGDGFFILSAYATGYVYTVSGTPLTATNCSLPIAAYSTNWNNNSDWYCLGSAYPFTNGNYLCCGAEGPQTNTPVTLSYIPSAGDVVALWNSTNQAYTFRTNNPNGTWSGLSSNEVPQLMWSTNYPLGRGMFLIPLGGTTNWLQYKYGSSCP